MIPGPATRFVVDVYNGVFAREFLGISEQAHRLLTMTCLLLYSSNTRREEAMPTFEEGFSEAENAAESVLKSLANVSTLARQLRKAAQDGNIAAVRRTNERLQDGINLIRQEVANAADAWPFTPEEEQGYLQEKYGEELKEEARKKNLRIFDRDGRLIAHPSVIRVMPGERAVEINRRRMSTIRPTKIVGELEKFQKRTPRAPQTVLESLYQAYINLTGVRQSDTMKFGEVGQVVQLRGIYDNIRLYTRLSGARLEYTQLDFAQDLYNLESSGVREAQSGARVSFPSATATRSSRGTIPFVGPDGESIIYYGIQFTGGGR
jgi:hypothetical protein